MTKSRRTSQHTSQSKTTAAKVVQMSFDVIEMSRYTPKSREEKADRAGWVRYGDQNDLPDYYLDLYRRSGMHRAIVYRTTQMIAGKGVNNPLFTDEMINDTALDVKLQGGFFWEVILSMDGQSVAKVNHLPFNQCRFEERDAAGNINHVYFSKDWADSKQKPVPIPVYNSDVLTDPDNPVRTFVYYSLCQTPGSGYYPDPDYVGAVDWIELDHQIAQFHVNNIQNGLFPSLIVDYFNGDPGPEARMEIMNALKKLQGGKNASKYVVNFNPPEGEAGRPQYTTFPINDADKLYQTWAEIVRDEILVGHGVISPLMFGIRDGGGLGSNTDELKMATALYTLQVIKPLQRLIENGISYITGQTATIEPNVPTFEVSAPVQPAQPAPAALKMASEQPQLSDEDSNWWIQHLREKGEVIDTDEWELVYEGIVIDSDSEAKYRELGLSSELHNLKFFSEYATPEERSEWGDSGLYKLRYQYAGGVSSDSRPFCREMMSDSSSGTVYRYEDITFMSASGVNGQFAPKGSSSYDIFKWKGGVYCHHYWKRLIYFRKRKNGKFLPNDGLNNDKRVGNVPFVPQKGEEGTRPIDTPSRGKLN